MKNSPIHRTLTKMLENRAEMNFPELILSRRESARILIPVLLLGMMRIACAQTAPPGLRGQRSDPAADR